MTNLNSCRSLMLLLALSLLSTVASAQLNGAYTIGGISPSYATITQAVADLNSQGVAGPVVFNIRDGSYNEQVVINSVAGASNSNTIVFKSESNNAANVSITTAGSNAASNYVFKLNNAKYVTLRHLTLAPMGSTYGTAVSINGNSSNDSIVNCNLTGAISNYTGYYAALIQAYNSSCSNIIIKNNSITDGGSGIYIYSSGAGSAQEDFVIEGNSISGQYYMPIFMQHVRDFKVRNNTITKGAPYGYGIYCNGGYDAYECSGNVVNMSNCNYSGYGLYHANCQGNASDSTKRVLIANNTLTQTNIQTTAYPIYNYNSSFMIFRGNVINITGNSTNYINNQNTPYMVFHGNSFNINTSASLYGYYLYQSPGGVADSNIFNISTGSGNCYSYFAYSGNSKVSNNRFNISSTTGTIYGLYAPFTSTTTGVEISGNRIKAEAISGTVYGINISGSTSVPDMGLSVFNNVVTTATSGSNRSCYATSLKGNNKFYNNTFHSRATGGANYAFYISPSSGSSNIVQNNIFSRTGTTGVLVSYGNSTLSDIDHNLYYAPSGNIIQSTSPSTTVAYNNLQAWRNSTSGIADRNSLVHNPGYVSGTSNNPDDLAPDLSSADAWSRNGRGTHIVGNLKDINGNMRVADRVSGVPDIGAHEFTPTSTPPAAVATPAVPVANGSQVFTLGQDTVATIAWGSIVPGTVTVRQYSGTAPPGISSVSSNHMYFYTDVNIPSGSYAHTSNVYYQDPWLGSTGNEASLRLAKKDGANPWTVYGPSVSSAAVMRNIISTSGSSNFGLHTGIDQGDNAGVNALTNPVQPFCSGNQMVIAQIKNSGNNVLNNVQIGWSVDGTAQTPVSYNTAINTLGSGLGNTATVNLGTVNFGSMPKVIKVWTYSPNGNTDPFKNDDTLTVSLRSSLSGTYTVGGTSPSYPTIAAAVSDLNTYGVCGPVVFDLRNGTYTERTILKPVTGASATNTITFKSETNNLNNVTVKYSSSSSANYIFLLDSASHFIFRDITVQTVSSSYGRVFEFRGTASHDSIIDCKLLMAGTSNSNRAGIYASTSFKGSGNLLKNSTVQGGYYGVYLYGSASEPVDNFIIDGNTFNSQYYYGLYTYYSNNLKYTNNKVNRSGSTNFYGGYVYYADGDFDYSGNELTLSNSNSTLYGLYMRECVASPGDYARIANNIFDLTNTGSNDYVYPTYFYQNSYDSIVNNSITANSNYYIYNYDYYASSIYFAHNTLDYTASRYYGYWQQPSNMEVADNTFNISGSNYFYWYLYNFNNVQFRDNDVNMTAASTSLYPRLWYPSNSVFERNDINASGAYSVYGLYAYGSQGTYQNNLFNANRIKAVSTNGSAYGIYNYSNDDWTYSNNVIIAQGSSNYAFFSDYPFLQNIYNNTFVTKNSSGYVFYSNNNGAHYQKLRNNIFYSPASNGSGLYFVNADAAVLSSDYNDIYVGGTTKFSAGGTYNTLAQWRAAKDQDMNSLMYDPGFTNPSADNYTPDPANSASWSLNGRAQHIAGNDKDIMGNTRVTSKAAGVPDIGCYEFTPTSTPPSATATPAAPAAGITQVFTLGEDTIATVSWDASATVPSTIDVKQYSGTLPPSFIAANSMYLYTDIAASGALHDVKIYYKDPQTGTTIGESGLRLVKKDGSNPWSVFSNPQSATNPKLNFNNSSALTTFGLHTMTDVPNNASAAELAAPVSAFCAPSTQEVKVKIKNNGNNILNSVKIGWTKNGAAQPIISYTSPIYTLGSSQGNEVTISLGNVSFPNSNGVSFVVYTFSPNNATDPAPVDDTLKFTIKPSLNGMYTIGGATPDYLTVGDAINDLNDFGICGPVVFNIRDGNYTDGGKIAAPLQGSSAINRVTFRSESGVAANAVITHAASNANDNAIFGLDNISNITINRLKLVTTNGSFSTAIAMGGTASYDSIVGCILQAPTSGSASFNSAPIQANDPTFTGTENVILKNIVTGGYAGICLNSGGGASKNIVDSNTLSNQYYYGLYLNYTHGTKVRGNTLNLSSPVYFGVQVMYNYASDTVATEFTGNTVNTTGPTYPIRIYYMNQGGSNTVRGKFAHNIINASGSTVYGYLYSPYYTDVHNNKINLNSTGYVNNYFGYSGQYCKFHNNEVKVSGTYGYGWYASNVRYSNMYNNVVIANFGSSYTAYGMYASYGTYDSIYNNTVLVTSVSSTCYALYGYMNSSSYSNNWVRNNLFANFSTAPAAAASWINPGSSYNNTFDFNNYYASNGNSIYNGATSQPQTLQAWRNYSGQDKNSLCYDPGVINTTSDAHPNANDSASWSVNGRGMHIAGNDADLEGNTRVTAPADGVPDIGAYEFVPNSTPPLAVAVPAVPAVGKQVFTFGQDTVAVIDWKANSQIPNAIDVRSYTGTVPPGFPANVGFMYFYTDVNVANSTYNFTADIYYDDPWRGTIPAEADIRMAKKLPPQPWQAYNSPLSSVDVNRNIIRAGLTQAGYMTGIEDGTLFSAIITPAGSGIFCPGGSVVLNANTGIGYTYQWQFNYVDIPGATGASYTATGGGDYTVKITNTANVTATSLPFLVTIVAPPAAQVSANGPLAYCTGGNLTLAAATAANQTYQWYLNGNPIPSATQSVYQVNSHGNYTVMVNGIGCSSTSPVTVVSEGPIQVNLGQDTSFCEGTPFILDAGYPGAKYLWNTGDTSRQITIHNKLQSGSYTVAVDAGPNCQGSDNIVVTVNPLPAVFGISYVKSGSTYVFSPSGATDVKNFLWLFSDNTNDTAKTATHTFSIPEFEVKLIVFNDCGTDTAILKLPVNVNETTDHNVEFIVYPNPASEWITLSSDGDVKFSEVVIVNSLGQVVYTGNTELKLEEEVDVSSFANGRYLIRANTSSGKSIVKIFNVVK